MRLAFVFFSLFLVACGARQAQPQGEETVISLVDIGCASCGEGAVALLKARDDVYGATWARDAAEVTVRYDPKKTTPDALAALVKQRVEVQTAVGPGKGSYAKTAEWPADADLKNIAPKGEAVELVEHLAHNKATVFDFYADWCGPCRDVDLALLDMYEERGDFAVRKLNVVDWQSAVAKRYLSKAAELPYVVVYGADGEQVDAIAGKDLKRLREAVERATASKP